MDCVVFVFLISTFGPIGLWILLNYFAHTPDFGIDLLDSTFQ